MYSTLIFHNRKIFLCEAKRKDNIQKLLQLVFHQLKDQSCQIISKIGLLDQTDYSGLPVHPGRNSAHPDRSSAHSA